MLHIDYNQNAFWQVDDLKLTQPYLKTYASLISPESIKLLYMVEPNLRDLYQEKFGNSVADVRVTSLEPGSVVVHHVVVLTQVINF